MTTQQLTIEPASEHVGAFVSGIDLAQAAAPGGLGPETTAVIKDAWAKHGVLFFREQPITPEQHMAFAEHFAAIDINKFFAAVDGFPGIAQVLKEKDQEHNIGGSWHTDHTYDAVPARGSILLARETPATGGDTHFLSVGAAYDALTEDLKATIATLEAHHSSEHVFGAKAEHAKEIGDRFGNADAVGGTTHPLVIKHPETGRKMLYVNAAFVTGIVGWSDDESTDLLNQLYRHIVNGGFDYRFEWEVGSIAMWDNCATWHMAYNDYPGQRRLMHRITVEGVALDAAA